MGLNSGDVVVGRIGDDLRMDYTAQGHVGLAQRMESIAESGQAFVTAHTAHLVEGTVHQLERPARHSQELVEKCATYWHTVDFLWVLIFALLYVMR